MEKDIPKTDKSLHLSSNAPTNKYDNVIGSRKRTVKHMDGSQKYLIVRRLYCISCRVIHHELPDTIVPYKRYVSDVIEAVIDGQIDAVPCETSTIDLWQEWFKRAKAHIANCISAVCLSVLDEEFSLLLLRREGKGWLKRIVRILVNTNNWGQTRFAFMPIL